MGTPLDYLDYMIADDIARSEELARIGFKISPIIAKLTKLFQNDSVQKVLTFLKTDSRFKAFCDWAPAIITIFSGITFILNKQVKRGISMITSGVSQLWGKFMDRFTDISPRIILQRLWDALPWHLLWNPWFVAGAIALAGCVWMLYSVYADASGAA